MQRLNHTAIISRCCIRFNSTAAQPVSEPGQSTSAKLSRRVLTDLGGISIPSRKDISQLKPLALARDHSRDHQPNMGYLKNTRKTPLSKRLHALKTTASVDLQLREDPHIIARRTERMEREALKAARYHPAQPELAVATSGAASVGNLEQHQVEANVVKTEAPVVEASSGQKKLGENSFKRSTPSVSARRTSSPPPGTNSVEEIEGSDDPDVEPIEGPETPTSLLPGEGTRDLGKIFGQQDRLDVVRHVATGHGPMPQYRIRSLMATHGGDYAQYTISNPRDYSIPSNQLHASQRAQLVLDHRADLHFLQRSVAQDIIRASVGVEGTQTSTSQ